MDALLGLSTDQEYADAQTFYEDLGALAQQKGYVQVLSTDYAWGMGIFPWVSRCSMPYNFVAKNLVLANSMYESHKTSLAVYR